MGGGDYISYPKLKSIKGVFFGMIGEYSESPLLCLIVCLTTAELYPIWQLNSILYDSWTLSYMTAELYPIWQLNTALILIIDASSEFCRVDLYFMDPHTARDVLWRKAYPTKLQDNAGIRKNIWWLYGSGTVKALYPGYRLSSRWLRLFAVCWLGISEISRVSSVSLKRFPRREGYAGIDR